MAVKAVAVIYHFEWDPRKATGNLRKHGTDFEQAATVFLDPLQVTVFDEPAARGTKSCG